MTQMIAGGLKLGGDPDYARAMAEAVLLPDIAKLEARNHELEDEVLALRKRRWQQNARKIEAYKADMKPASWPELLAGALIMGLQALVRLLIVREE